MSCYHPMKAWRSREGREVSLGKELRDAEPLQLPCGSCLGCRLDQARGWALRCHLEHQQHPHSVFTTLTYADAPKLLWKPDLQLWLKRLRKALAPDRVRFFASGEYGDRRQRPHYHALLFGVGTHHSQTIEKTWGHGYTHTVPITPASIAYVAGYCQKKLDYKLVRQVDEETGEVLWEPPFREMSRRPGVGGHWRHYPHSDRLTKQQFNTTTTGWRDYAIHQGMKIPVPRYLHEAWKQTATQEEKEKREWERFQQRALRETLTTEEITQQLRAREALAAAKQNLHAARRKYDRDS